MGSKKTHPYQSFRNFCASSNLAVVLEKQGKLEEARLRFLGYTEVAERLVRVSFLASHFHLGLNL